MKKLAIGIALPLAAVSLHAACVDQDVDLPRLVGEPGMTVPRPGTEEEMAGAGGMAGSADAGAAAGSGGAAAGAGGVGIPDSGAPDSADASTADAGL